MNNVIVEALCYALQCRRIDCEQKCSRINQPLIAGRFGPNAFVMKDIVYWIAAVLEEANIGSLCKAWCSLLPESDPDEGMSDVPTGSPITDVPTAAPLGKGTQAAVAE